MTQSDIVRVQMIVNTMLMSKFGSYNARRIGHQLFWSFGSLNQHSLIIDETATADDDIVMAMSLGYNDGYMLYDSLNATRKVQHAMRQLVDLTPKTVRTEFNWLWNYCEQSA